MMHGLMEIADTAQRGGGDLADVRDELKPAEPEWPTCQETCAAMHSYARLMHHKACQDPSHRSKDMFT